MTEDWRAVLARNLREVASRQRHLRVTAMLRDAADRVEQRATQLVGEEPRP